MGKFVGAVVGAVMIGVGIVTGQGWLVAIGASVMMGSVNALLAPSMKARTNASQSLQLGEVARSGMAGQGSTAGSLVDGFNYGGKYGTDWTVLVIALADHLCEGLVGLYANDKYAAFTGDGYVAGFKNQLQVYWRPGSWDQTVPAILTGNCPVVGGVPTWTANDRGRGVCYVVVAYKADKADAKNPVWAGGTPRFEFILKGARCYSARKDSTVGGSGLHRWNDPTTREWSDNPIDFRHTWQRGFYAGDKVTQPEMLLLGRGLSAIEAPPANVFAPANVCDEMVALKAGGSEKRYRLNGAFGGDDRYIETEEDIAAAVGGIIVEREGAVEIIPGAAQPVVWDITDDDMLIGSTVKRTDFFSQTDEEWVNGVAAKYIEPTQRWKDHSAPIRRNVADMTADGEPRISQPTLPLVTSGTQAQRIAEQVRRMGRMPLKRELKLGPRFIGAEHGDWLRWTSKRYRRPGDDPANPTPIVFRIQSDSQDESWQNSLTLREISASVYPWTTADEITPGAVAQEAEAPDFSEGPDAGDWTLAALAVGATVTLRFAGEAEDGVDGVVFEYATGATAPDPDDDSLWTLGGMGGSNATGFDVTGKALDTQYWGAVSYISGAARSDRLVIGPRSVTTASLKPGSPTLLTKVGQTDDTATISARAPEYAPFEYLRFYAGSTAVFADAVAISGEVVCGTGEVVQITETAIQAGQRYYWAVAYSSSDVASDPTGPLALNIGGVDFSGGTMPANVSFSRSSAGNRTNAAGSLVSEAANVLRFDYDPITHALLGVLIEPSSANEIANNLNSGAVMGVIGSGGALPTNWTYSSGDGLTRQIVGISTVGGMEYIDLRVFGTVSSNMSVTLRPEGSVSAAAGSTWANSIHAALIAGSMANVTGFQLRAGSDAGGTSLTSVLDANLTRYSNIRTLTGTIASNTLRWIYTAAGVAVDFTLRLAIPQRESGGRMTSPIKTGSGSVTRSADVLTVNWAARHVPDGSITVRYTFDDMSTQDVATTVASGLAVVPTNLNRTRIRKLERI
ncbi:phage tail protein [Sphingobium sp. WCS2017Hpa-17]|uniref:phage tail protein n=1 Tax=Sphingobium sp. WCS2017Hpa-17 TaxID=3073638 RepID=UPI00288B0EC4|nr:phage tail protein [Sphingobium sp. WCS2017Hpa-17]